MALQRQGQSNTSAMTGAACIPAYAPGWLLAAITSELELGLQA